MPPPQTNACNALVNAGPDVTAIQVGTDAPAATGGVVVDGTYHLTDLTIYTGAGGPSGPVAIQVKQTVAVHGTSADANTSAGGKSQSQSSTFVTSGTSVTIATTCPTAEPPQTGAYSATATSMVLFLPNGQGNMVRYTYVP